MTTTPNEHPPNDAWPEIGPPPPLGLQLGYRFALLVEPSGVVRDVVEAAGIGIPVREIFPGRRLPEISARQGGAERGAEWERRIKAACEATEVAHYADPPPGAGPDAEPTVDCRLTPIRRVDGTLEAILVEIDDRSTLQTAERELANSEQRFRHLAETLPQLVFVTDHERNGVYFSPRWATYTGRPLESLLGKGYFDVIHPEDLDLITAARAAADSTKAVKFRLLNADGTHRWVEAHVTFVLDENGSVLSVVGGLTDITERLREEEARIRSQKREVLGTLAAGMAHDFNNVIGAIVSNASLAQTEIEAGDSAETSVAEIAQAAVRAADLVRRMLAYSREEEPSHVEVSARELIGEVCDLLAATLPRTIQLRQKVDPAAPDISGDPSQLHQVLMNLVANARQAIGDPPGTIDIVVDCVELAQPLPSDDALPAGDYVRIRVTDDGQGMPEAVLRRAFDPFFTTKPVGEGTGLGLAAARTIIHAHKGTIEVESTPTVGSSVTVLLPSIASNRSDPHRLPVDATKPTDGAARIAFVDDEQALATLASRALPLYDCEPTVFTDPQAALEAITAAPHSFDALITDHAMPGLSGLELIAEVRKVRPDLPVVLTSGFLTASHRDEAERHRVDAIVPKPCSIEQLATVAKGLVGNGDAD